ncbi:MAG: hypothetical protein LQ347_005561 [Umbilicaria vellea]|nr:MAG: hypothetical protein LQ347_005561 [Umbilicaria vellea]
MPSYLLWKVQVNWRRKIAPGGVLFFNIFVITFAIVRIIVASVGQGHADEIQLYLWSNLDFAMAIIVACISPFRQRNTRRERGPAQARPVVARITTYLHSTLGQLRKRNKAPSNFSDGIVLVDLEPSAGRSFASLGSLAIDPIVPLDFISVRHDIGESSDLQSGEVQFTKTSTGSPHMPRDAS